MLKTKPAGSMQRESDSEDQMWGSLQEFFSENPKGFFKILSQINEGPDSHMFKAINLVRDEIVAIKEIVLKREDDKLISELTSFDPSAQSLQCEIRVIDKFLCKKDDTNAVIWLELEYCQMGSLKEIAVNRTSEFFPSDIGSELTTLIGLLDNNKSGSEENFSADIKELIEALRAGEDFERILETKIISENRGHFQYIKGSIYNTRKRAIVNYRKSTMCQFLPDTLKKSINLTNSIYIDSFEEKKDGTLKEKNSRKKQLSQDIGNISQILMNPNVNPTFLSSGENNSNSYLLFSNGGQVSSQLSEEYKLSQLKISEQLPNKNKNILQLFSDKKVKVKKRKTIQEDDRSAAKESDNNTDSSQVHSDRQDVIKQKMSAEESNRKNKKVVEVKELLVKESISQERKNKKNDSNDTKQIGIQIINQHSSTPVIQIIPLVLEQQKLVTINQDEGLKKKCQELEKITIEKPQNNKRFSMKTEQQQSPLIAAPSQRQNIEKQPKINTIEPSRQQQVSPQNQEQELNQNFATFGANLIVEHKSSNTPQHHTNNNTLSKDEERIHFQNNKNQLNRLEGNLKVTTKKPSLNGSVIMIASERMSRSSSSSSSNSSNSSSSNSQQLIEGIHPIPQKTNSAEGYLHQTYKNHNLNKRNSSPVKKSSESPKLEMPSNHYSPQTLSSPSSSPHILHSPFSMRHLIPNNKTESNQIISSRPSFQEKVESTESSSLIKLCMLEIDQDKRNSLNHIQQSASPKKQPIFSVNIPSKRSSLLSVGEVEKESDFLTKRETQTKRGTSFSQRKSIFQDPHIQQRKSLRSCGVSDSRITNEEDSKVKQVKPKCLNAAVMYKNKNVQENSVASSIQQKPMLIEQKQQPQSMKQEIISRNETQSDVNKGVISSQIESRLSKASQNTLQYGQKQVLGGKIDNTIYQESAFHLSNSPYPTMVTPVKKPQELVFHRPSIEGNNISKEKSQNPFQDSNNIINNNNLISFLSDTRASSLIFCNGSHGKASTIHFESAISSPNQPQNSSPFQFSVRESSPEKNNSPIVYAQDPYSRSNQIPRRKFGQDLTSHFSEAGEYLGNSPISSLNQQKTTYQPLQLFQAQRPAQQIVSQQSKLSSIPTSQQTQQQQLIYSQKSQQHQSFQSFQQDQFQQKNQQQQKQPSNNLPQSQQSQQYFFPQYQNLTQQQYSQFANQDSITRQKGPSSSYSYSRQLSPINSSLQQQTNYTNRYSPYVKDPSLQTQSHLTSQPAQQQRFNTMQALSNQQISSWHGDNQPQQTHSNYELTEKQTQKTLNLNSTDDLSNNFINNSSQSQKTPIFLSRGYSRSELPINRNTSIS